MQKQVVDYELTGGRSGSVRILAVDKVRMEGTVRTNRWPLEDGPRTATLILFYALRRTNALKSEDYDAFIDTELVDYAAHSDEDEGEDAAPL